MKAVCDKVERISLRLGRRIKMLVGKPGRKALQNLLPRLVDHHKVDYVVVDTAQTSCYNDSTSITAPATGQPFYGQDAQFHVHLWASSRDRSESRYVLTVMSKTRSPTVNASGVSAFSDIGIMLWLVPQIWLHSP